MPLSLFLMKGSIRAKQPLRTDAVRAQLAGTMIGASSMRVLGLSAVRFKPLKCVTPRSKLIARERRDAKKSFRPDSCSYGDRAPQYCHHHRELGSRTREFATIRNLWDLRHHGSGRATCRPNMGRHDLEHNDPESCWCGKPDSRARCRTRR